MLSPSTRATLSSPMNSSPMMKACARPSGDGCTAYSRRMPSVDAVAEQRAELLVVLGRRDDQDLADARHHQRRQRVVDHRLVVDRHELLRDALGDRPQPGAGAAGEDDAAHRHAPRVQCVVEGARGLPGGQEAGCRGLGEARRRPCPSARAAARRRRSGNVEPDLGVERVDAVLALGVERRRHQVADGRVVGRAPRSSGRGPRRCRSPGGRRRRAAPSPTGRRSANRRGCR